MVAKLSAPIVTKKLKNRLRGVAAQSLAVPSAEGGSMMLFDKTGRPAVRGSRDRHAGRPSPAWRVL